MVLYYTVQYNKLIKKLHKSFIKFDNLYNFLSENKFIEHLNMVEITIEDVLPSPTRLTSVLETLSTISNIVLLISSSKQRLLNTV